MILIKVYYDCKPRQCENIGLVINIFGDSKALHISRVIKENQCVFNEPSMRKVSNIFHILWIIFHSIS